MPIIGHITKMMSLPEPVPARMDIWVGPQFGFSGRGIAGVLGLKILGFFWKVEARILALCGPSPYPDKPLDCVGDKPAIP